VSALPASAWGDAAFHLSNAIHSLEVAAGEAASRGERDLATRIRSALDGVQRRVEETARRLEPEPVAELMGAEL
jgi:hypothetical protein